MGSKEEDEPLLNADEGMANHCAVHPRGTLLNPVEFASLSHGAAEIWIQLNGCRYRLSQTKQGRLILTK